jgi:hypothetical protein
MASLQHRRDRYYVRRRDGGRDSKEHTEVFRALADAEAFKAEIERGETARRVLRDVPGIPGWNDGGGYLGTKPVGDPLVEYARRMIELDDNLRPGDESPLSVCPSPFTSRGRN